MSETRAARGLVRRLKDRAEQLGEWMEIAADATDAIEAREDAALHKDALTEIARLTRELEEARERERALREALEGVLPYVHESHHGEALAALEASGIDIDALAATPPEEAGGE